MRPLWRGRVLALLAIVFVALNLRTAVAALSPIFDEISADIPLGSVGIGLLGMLPPVCFAVVGLFAPALHRRFGLERVVIGALTAILLGQLARGASGSYLVLVLASTLTFAGMGVANVLLPPLVKRYFPDRIGLVTSLYATVMALGASVPALIAVQVSDSAGWRVSVGMWSVLAVLALLPLVLLSARERRVRRAERQEAVERRASAEEPAAVDVPTPAVFGLVWRSPIAWSLMLVFGVTALNSYALFAWLPEILLDVSTVSQEQSGALLSLFAVMGLPAALLVPILAARMRNVYPLMAAGAIFDIVGYGGLLLAPDAVTWLWVALVGLGGMLFPLCLVLINLRTRTHEGAVALSSFVQSFGYGLGALGPLLLGVLHEASGGWTVPLLFLLATALTFAICGIVVSKPRMLEDQWHN
ncbi:MFS transporter [Herbiconiux ginsengi]|uniref:MFS transporter, CP family, cyanate transporter n=1 Tax=Herbiconiux ginsengi TaxID=381665 RepID=A0A1H3Q140_9MICO|nr:MFS transporter [Herbiconiux ginsengi]SDZ07222.1 MFS transporter, CP family, cyanate transporter [Herbiconiux ginsengi]